MYSLHARHLYSLAMGGVTWKLGLNCLEDKWWGQRVQFGVPEWTMYEDHLISLSLKYSIMNEID